jgi:hypothetical protein
MNKIQDLLSHTVAKHKRNLKEKEETKIPRSKMPTNN